MIKKEPPYTIVLSALEREAMERIRALRRVRSWAEAIRQMIGENDPDQKPKQEAAAPATRAKTAAAEKPAATKHWSNLKPDKR